MASTEQIEAAAFILKTGGLGAFPTETVYGLGADASNGQAIQRIYQVKNRPSNHPLIIHISDQRSVSHWAKSVPSYASALMEFQWDLVVHTLGTLLRGFYTMNLYSSIQTADNFAFLYQHSFDPNQI
jgi:tRNA threonylcarbamoyl adenosine modification protein (Sua5/YciO/YrdC/YwlC family)